MMRSRRLYHDLARALWALALLCGAASPTEADDAKHLTSILIVARSELPDPFFAGSVVLVMNNLAPGPVGLIINRPTEVSVSRLFPDLKSLPELHEKLYFGGPVEPDLVWFLVRAEASPGHAVRVCEGVYLSADRDLLLKLLGRSNPMEGLKVFVGHAGWAPGQLEAEIGNGDWSSKQADSKGIFNGQRESPWPPKGHPGDSI